jgi:hypothetical protein
MVNLDCASCWPTRDVELEVNISYNRISEHERHVYSQKEIKPPLVLYKVTDSCITRASILLGSLITFSWINTGPAKFSPNLAETGTLFLRGTRRSLQVFSSGNSHFMWRLKFSLRIERITLTMLVLLSLSLGEERNSKACNVHPSLETVLWPRVALPWPALHCTF